MNIRRAKYSDKDCVVNYAFITEEKEATQRLINSRGVVIIQLLVKVFKYQYGRILALGINIPLDEECFNRFPVVFIFESALRRCSIPTQQIIVNDFIKARNDKWYEDQYSVATYYRRRQEGIEEFLSKLI